MIAVLLTPLRAALPVYAQVEVDSTAYLGGTTALPPTATGAPAETLFLAPEVFLGPFESFLSDGTRLAGGVSFNLVGDPVHDRTYTVTVAFDIPNQYGY